MKTIAMWVGTIMGLVAVRLLLFHALEGRWPSEEEADGILLSKFKPLLA